MPDRRRKVLLVGEALLVKELGESIDSKKFDVLCRVNSGGSKISFPKSFKRVASIPKNVDVAFELTNTNKDIKKKNLVALDKSLGKNALVLSSSLTVTVAEQATWLKHPSRLVGICALPSLLAKPLIELAPSIYTDASFIEQVQRMLREIGKGSTLVQDRIGMVMPRIVCQLVNEAFFAILEDVASPENIDTAMKLGTNYPLGPIEWGKKIGFDQVVAVLDAIRADLGEERYRVSPLLRQLALSAR